MIGDIQKNQTPVSLYQPSKEVVDLTSLVKEKFSRGVEILNKSWVELNDMSVLDRRDRDQRTFNAFVDENIEDPNEAWKWRGTRSKARNKAVQMHAQLTAGYVIPMYVAQNDDDEEDRNFSDLMRDMAEWVVDNTNYKTSYLMAVMGMLVNPVTYMGAEYNEVYQTIREKTEQGYTKKEVLDDVLSGFDAPIYSADQILISNAFQQNIQRQATLIKRRYIEYSESEAMYGNKENFIFVKPGFSSVYSEDDGMFYDIKDDDHPTMVEEAIYLNRREDTEIVFVGGIYMGEADIENNPIKHRNNRNAPRYNVVPFGYQRVNEHFFFYKSLMNSQYWDNQLLDAQYEMGMNRLFLDTNMPVAITGASGVDTEVIFPGSMTSFDDKDAKVTPILPQANMGNIFAGMNAVEKSIDESSLSDTTGGQLPDREQKATTVNIAQQNAKIMLQGVGKTLAESVVQFGNLLADCIINNLTAAQVVEIAGDKTKIKYRTFILDNKTMGDKKMSKILKFDETLLGKEMTKEQKDMEEMKMLEEVGYPKNKSHLIRINPEVFARFKYLAKVVPETMFPRNEEYMQALVSQMYKELRNDPLVNADSLVRKVLYWFFRGESDGMMAEQPNMQQLPPGLLGGDGGKPNVAAEMIKKGAMGGVGR